MPHRDIPNQQRSNARRLRQTMTDVERKLWRALRAHRFAGASFRRQLPIGAFIVDFACHAARLVIELDGSQHGTDDGLVRDRARDAAIAREGYLVLRFWNAEINADFDAVMDRIYVELVDRGLPLGSSVFTAATPLPASPLVGEAQLLAASSCAESSTLIPMRLASEAVKSRSR